MLKADKRCLRKEEKVSIRRILSRFEKASEKIYGESGAAAKVFTALAEEADGLGDLKYSFREITELASAIHLIAIMQKSRKIFGGKGYYKREEEEK